MIKLRGWLLLGVAVTCYSSAGAAEPAKLSPLAELGPNRKDEPLAKNFSVQRAARFLDNAALAWQNEKKCFTCHTNYAYLYARPLVAADAAAHKEVRRFAEELVRERWLKQGPRWDAEVVATAAALAFNDAATTGKLHPLTKTALDRMWTVQRKDGGWTWLKCNWPPMESDDHYGATLAALAVGVAPGGYANTEAAQKGLARLRDYLKKGPPIHVHHRAMLLWGSTYLDGFMPRAEKAACIKELSALQKADGGWALATLGNYTRADKKEQDFETSDGYATGFVVYVLRRAGVPADEARIKKGIAWLKSNQRESGRWFTRSANRDSKHYISHAGTAFAVMALAECGELKKTTARR
ncbi:MAG: terpene cyclase/mutase family protein [Planctomycetes bacterium]|nr:terpene cyclase/mutase family protein [Planctomycetota bacterium]